MEKENGYTIADITCFTDEYDHVHTVNLRRLPLAGGQGCVFFTNDEKFAGKICFKKGGNQILSQDTSRNDEFYRLRQLPIPREAYVTLPIAVLKDYHGYIMQLLDGMVPFSDGLLGAREIELPSLFQELPKDYQAILCQYISGGGSRHILLAYMKAARSLAMLHAKGLVYCDFSENNVFISASQGYDNVWLIDADNIDYEEELEKTGKRIFTPGIGAPEVVRDNPALSCSFWSDCYAFAISLFQRIYLQHPFEGTKYLELEDENDDFGETALLYRNWGLLPWIFDEDDDENEIPQPVLLAHPFLLTRRLRQMFQETFSDESRNKDECVRPTMMEWAYTLAWSYDNTVRGNCGLDYIAENVDFGICPWDDSPVPAIRVVSYREVMGTLRRQWQYTHETNEKITLPYRLVSGFSCTEIDKIAFRGIYEDSCLTLTSEMPIDWHVEGSSDGINFTAGYRFIIDDNQYVLRLTSRNGKKIIMKVRLV